VIASIFVYQAVKCCPYDIRYNRRNLIAFGINVIPHLFKIQLKTDLLFVLLWLVVSPVYGQGYNQNPLITPASIFGDGDPVNGVEDDRQQLMNGRRKGLSLDDQRMNAGTIVCDGKTRGTAMVIDTREFAPDLKGVVLASAAHVFYDLEKNRRFKRCEFHLLALSALSSYQAKIDLKQVVTGGFDPGQATDQPEFGQGDWAFVYVARPWRNFDRDETLVAGVFPQSQLETFQQSGGEFRLIAFDSDNGVISMSRHCTVVESRSGDLGGGTWQGQLLDDCDSTGGSSGGGIVAIVDGQQYLVGIRNGSHWSEEVFPSGQFPQGPPDGSLWNRHTNTNFGRAIDAQLIHELRRFSQNLEAHKSLF